MKKVGRKANPSPYEITSTADPKTGAFPQAGHPEQPAAAFPFARKSPTTCVAFVFRKVKPDSPDYFSRHAASAASMSFCLMERSRE